MAEGKCLRQAAADLQRSVATIQRARNEDNLSTDPLRSSHDRVTPLTGMEVVAGVSCPSLRRTSIVALDHLRLLGARVRVGKAPAADRHRGDVWRLKLFGGGVAVECVVTGWGDWDKGPFDEALAQAVSGVMAVHGRGTGGPRRLGIDYASVFAGVLTVQSILACALGQLRGARVQHVELDVARAAAFALLQYVAQGTADEDPDVIPAEEMTEHARPPFSSCDGVWFELESLDAGPWRAFWALLGASPGAVQHSWRPFTMRYGRATSPLQPELLQTTRKVTFERVLEAASVTGMSVCRIRSVAERRTDPGLWPATGTCAPWVLTPSPGRRAGGKAHPGGSLPLAGVRVIESARRMQGPLATRLLALFGAEVTRIEPPGGEPARGMPPLARGRAAGFLSANHGKQVVEINFKTAEGHAQTLDLVRDADVFLHNWAPKKAGMLQLDSDDLHAVNPGLVYAYASGWGDVLGEDPPLGTDFQVQAYSGVAEQVSRGEQGPPRPTLMIITDVLGAAVSAEGMLAGLVARQRFGMGSRVDTSLFSSATTLLAEDLRAVPPVAAPAAQVDKVFPTADGHLAVCARTTECLGRLAVRVGAATGTPEEIEGRLTKLLAERPSDTWENEFRALGIPAVTVVEDVCMLPRIDHFSSMFDYDGCFIAMAPWRFSKGATR
jgi:CoA:oxalate CoA-transferase